MALMDIISSLILSLIQGLTEFLPISSSGHLALASYFFNLREPSLGFSVALHIGTLLAVLVYFWKDWIIILFRGARKSIFPEAHSEYTTKTLWLIVLATIPAVIFGSVWKQAVATLALYPQVVIVFIILGGALLWIADIYGKKNLSFSQINWKTALVIGLSQILALFAGISRSGITMAAGLMLGLGRKDTARFSFLMATPIIIGAAILEFSDLLKSGMNANVFLGILISFVIAYVTIAFMMRFIEKVHYRIFFWYSLLLALIFVVAYIL